jgi:hypothetical protein
VTGTVRRGGRGAAAALALVLAVAAHARAADDLAPNRPATAPARAVADFALSRPADNLWRWATVERAAPARSAPAADAPVVARVRRRTPEHTPEAVPLLVRRVVGGRLWVRVRLPVLPNGTTGWVRRSALGGYETVRTHLVIDRRVPLSSIRQPREALGATAAQLLFEEIRAGGSGHHHRQVVFQPELVVRASSGLRRA